MHICEPSARKKGKKEEMITILPGWIFWSIFFRLYYPALFTLNWLQPIPSACCQKRKCITTWFTIFSFNYRQFISWIWYSSSGMSTQNHPRNSVRQRKLTSKRYKCLKLLFSRLNKKCLVLFCKQAETNWSISSPKYESKNKIRGKW